MTGAGFILVIFGLAILASRHPALRKEGLSSWRETARERNESVEWRTVTRSRFFVPAIIAQPAIIRSFS
jgi:hypothetical protein